MGNRAVICFDTFQPKSIGIYLHWNGGRDSIEGFLIATRKHMETRGQDAQYSKARFIQMVTTFFPGNLSVGLDHCENLDCDNYDNGVYVIDSKSLEITKRFNQHMPEQYHHDSQAIADLILKQIKAAETIKN